MEIVAKMDDREFWGFMRYRANRGMHAARLKQVENAPSMIARSLLNAVELVGGKSQKRKIADQEHMGDACSIRGSGLIDRWQWRGPRKEGGGNG